MNPKIPDELRQRIEQPFNSKAGDPSDDEESTEEEEKKKGKGDDSESEEDEKDDGKSMTKK